MLVYISKVSVRRHAPIFHHEGSSGRARCGMTKLKNCLPPLEAEVAIVLGARQCRGCANRTQVERLVTSSGFRKVIHLTDDQLNQFLDLVRGGTQAIVAARQLDPPTSITQIRRRATKDMEFAALLQEARDKGREIYEDTLREEAVRQAFAGDYRALRDHLVMHAGEVEDEEPAFVPFLLFLAVCFAWAVVNLTVAWLGWWP